MSSEMETAEWTEELSVLQSILDTIRSFLVSLENLRTWEEEEKSGTAHREIQTLPSDEQVGEMFGMAMSLINTDIQPRRIHFLVFNPRSDLLEVLCRGVRLSSPLESSLEYAIKGGCAAAIRAVVIASMQQSASVGAVDLSRECFRFLKEEDIVGQFLVDFEDSRLSIEIRDVLGDLLFTLLTLFDDGKELVISGGGIPIFLRCVQDNHMPSVRVYAASSLSLLARNSFGDICKRDGLDILIKSVHWDPAPPVRCSCADAIRSLVTVYPRCILSVDIGIVKEAISRRIMADFSEDSLESTLLLVEALCKLNTIYDAEKRSYSFSDILASTPKHWRKLVALCTTESQFVPIAAMRVLQTVALYSDLKLSFGVKLIGHLESLALLLGCIMGDDFENTSLGSPSSPSAADPTKLQVESSKLLGIMISQSPECRKKFVVQMRSFPSWMTSLRKNLLSFLSFSSPASYSNMDVCDVNGKNLTDYMMTVFGSHDANGMRNEILRMPQKIPLVIYEQETLAGVEGATKNVSAKLLHEFMIHAAASKPPELDAGFLKKEDVDSILPVVGVFHQLTFLWVVVSTLTPPPPTKKTTTPSPVRSPRTRLGHRSMSFAYGQKGNDLPPPLRSPVTPVEKPVKKPEPKKIQSGRRMVTLAEEQENDAGMKVSEMDENSPVRDTVEEDVLVVAKSDIEGEESHKKSCDTVEAKDEVDEELITPIVAENEAKESSQLHEELPSDTKEEIVSEEPELPSDTGKGDEQEEPVLPSDTKEEIVPEEPELSSDTGKGDEQEEQELSSDTQEEVVPEREESSKENAESSEPTQQLDSAVKVEATPKDRKSKRSKRLVKNAPSPLRYSRLENGFWVRMPLGYKRKNTSRGYGSPPKGMSRGTRMWTKVDVKPTDLFTFKVSPDNVTMNVLESLIKRAEKHTRLIKKEILICPVHAKRRSHLLHDIYDSCPRYVQALSVLHDFGTKNGEDILRRALASFISDGVFFCHKNFLGIAKMLENESEEIILASIGCNPKRKAEPLSTDDVSTEEAVDDQNGEVAEKEFDDENAAEDEQSDKSAAEPNADESSVGDDVPDHDFADNVDNEHVQSDEEKTDEVDSGDGNSQPTDGGDEDTTVDDDTLENDEQPERDLSVLEDTSV